MGGARGAARGGEGGWGRLRGLGLARMEAVRVTAEEGSRDTALDAAAERTLETRLGAAARMPTTPVQRAARTRSSPNRCHSRAARKPCAARRRRGGARRCSLLAARQARVSCAQRRRRRRRRRGGGGGGGGVGEARCCRRLRRRQRAADAGRWSGGRRRPRSAGAKRWCSVDRPDERAARLSRSLARPTQHRRRRQSAARGAVRARTRDPGSGGRSGGTAVRPWRWRRPVRYCCAW